MHVTDLFELKDIKHKSFTEIKQATCIASMVKRNDEKLLNTILICLNFSAKFCFLNLQNLTLMYNTQPDSGR